MARVLTVGDVHEPVTHPGYRSFCRDVADKHKCETIVFIGDIVDWHAISFHTKHPEAKGAQDEYEAAKTAVGKWRDAFPRARVCIGNHDERVVRVAESVGIPESLVLSYRRTWNTPGWNWQADHIIDDVYYFHGIGSGGKYPAATSMATMLMSVVQGHIHSAAGIKWRANPQRRIFGMDVGCGIDDKAVAFKYGKHSKTRSILACGVVIDGVPQHFIMPASRGEKYHRSRF